MAADQKSIDAAKAELAVAENDLGNATLVAPISGTVAAVAVAKGDSVSAGSTSSTITIVGAGTLSVDLSVGLTDIDLVKVGQSAAVTVDGHSGTLPAKVTYVGQTNTDTSSSTPAYTVTVTLDSVQTSLYDGMGAEVAIAVGSGSGLTVPVSALRTTGTRSTVEVYSGGTVVSTPVTVGLVGDTTVQVKSGLKAGQRVVIADLSEAVPSSSSDTSNRQSGLSGLTGSTGTGGFGGGGGFGGR